MNPREFVVDVTSELGGVADMEPITFMSEHRDAYRQLADAVLFAKIRPITKIA